MNKNFYEVESEIKSMVQYAPVDISFLKDKLSDRMDVSEDEIQKAIDRMVEEGKMFKPDAKSIQRV